MKAKHCTLGHVLGVLLVLCGSLFLSCTNENDLSGDQNDGTDPGRIATLEDQAASIEASIRDLEEVYEKHEELIEKLSTEVSGLEDLLDALESSGAYKDPTETQAYKELEERYSSLQNAKSLLSEKIDSLETGIAKLQEYVDGELATEDWAETTFLTLEQYGETLKELLSIKGNLETIDALVKKNEGDISAIKESINDLGKAITEAEESIKSWVNETLAAAYYDIETIKSKLEALETNLSGVDAKLAKDLADHIKAQQEALEAAKEKLTEDYKQAISEAIEENNGDIDDKIAKDIETANKYVYTEIGKINEEIVKLDERITAMEETVKNHGERIQTVKEQIDSIEVSIGELEDVCSDLEDFTTTLESEADVLRKQLEDNAEADSETKKALEDSIQFIESKIDTLKVKDKALDEQIAILREYVDGELAATEDWAEATSQTLKQYGETLGELLSIQKELEGIKTFVEENEGINDRINALESAIEDAKNSMEPWVHEKIANLENKVVELEESTEDMKKEYDKLQNEIDEICKDLNSELESQSEALDTLNSVQTTLREKQTELDEKVKDIENLISDYNAKVDYVITQAVLNEGRLGNVETVLAEIKAEIEAEVSEHDRYVEAIMHEISNLASEVDAILSEIEELRSQIEIGMVQSVVYMPEYSDGAAYVEIFSRTLEMSFKLSPSSVVASLKKVWESSLSVKFLTTKSTKAAPVMKDLSIKSAEFDETIGTVTVTVDCSNLDQSFYTGETSASASLFISDGHSNVSSDFVPLVLNVDVLSLEAANCYIVSESGCYQFRSAKGNSLELLSNVESAEVLWESFGTNVTPEEGDLVSAALYRDGNIYFKTADTFKEGNAVIAAKDASGTILWSWHIWLTDQPEEQVYYNNAGTMMDRNLGATSATPGDVGALGLLYQWGRKDPFLGSLSISSNIEAKSTRIWPSSVESDSGTGTIAYAIANPTTFITRNSENEDWHYTGSSSTDNTRWTTSATTKSIYDPCPSGWRVPDGGDNGIWSKAGFDDKTYDSTNEGMSFSISSPSITWYPASGFRDDGGVGLYNVGYHGIYWSASPYYNSACHLYFSSYGGVVPSNLNDSRASGNSVRCIKEGTGGGSSDSGDSNDNNVKEKREFDLGAQEVKWSYTPDAAQDAGKYLGLPYSYDRTLQVTTDEIKMQGALLGEGYEDVVTTGTLLSTTVNGVASTAVTFGYDAVSGKSTVTYTGFEWDKTYDIVANYETSATDVEIKFTLTTVDRKREPIIVKTNPTVSTPVKPLVYKKDMAIAQGTYNVPFGDKLFEELETAGNIAGIDKAAYLTDVFNSGKAYYDILNSWYDNDLWGGGRFLKDDGGADTWNTRLVIDGATCQFTFGYSYKSFPEVITNLKYVREFTTWYGQEFVLEHVLTIDLPKYDFAHTSYYVKANDDNTGWYSIMGQYTPSITATDVSAFEPNLLDMNKVFNVVDRATATPTIIPAADLASYGLVTEFALESTVPGISIRNNEISYLSSEDQIGVTGKLYIKNTDGSKLYLPTSFDDTYANYVVKKCDPIGKLTVTGTPVVELSEAKIYTVNVMDYLELKDNRNGVPTCDLIVDGAFLNGDGTNGYSGPVTSIYGLKYECIIEAFPSEFFSIISFNDSGVLTFDNTSQLTLFEDIVIPIRFSLSSLWCAYQVTVNVVFVKNVE